MPLNTPAPTPRLLIRGGIVLSGDERVGDLSPGDVLVAGGLIRAVAPRIEVDADTPVIDAGGGIVIPGFVDTHRHTWQSTLRMLGADWTLQRYFERVLYGLAPHYRPEDVRVGNLLGAAEALDAGVTTLVDWSHVMASPEHADAAVEGLRQSGIRAVFAWGEPLATWLDPAMGGDFNELGRLRKEHFSSGDDLVTLALAARGPQLASLEATERAWRAAREVGAPITVHVGAGPTSDERPISELARRGLLGADITYVHGNALPVEELTLIADSGGGVSMAPEVEMHMGHGMPATARVLAAGIRPGLSVDVCTNVAGDMFGAMRTTLATARGVHHQALLDQGVTPVDQPLRVRDVLEFATAAGARTCHLADRVGTLTPGKAADIVILRTDRPNLIPLNDPTAAVVLAAHPGDVDTVVVNGRVVKRRGRLLDIDLPRLTHQATASRDHLLHAAGIDPTGTTTP